MTESALLVMAVQPAIVERIAGPGLLERLAAATAGGRAAGIRVL